MSLARGNPGGACWLAQKDSSVWWLRRITASSVNAGAIHGRAIAAHGPPKIRSPLTRRATRRSPLRKDNQIPACAHPTPVVASANSQGAATTTRRRAALNPCRGAGAGVDLTGRRRRAWIVDTVR
jgi:hypothetical protein